MSMDDLPIGNLERRAVISIMKPGSRFHALSRGFGPQMDGIGAGGGQNPRLGGARVAENQQGV